MTERSSVDDLRELVRQFRTRLSRREGLDRGEIARLKIELTKIEDALKAAQQS